MANEYAVHQADLAAVADAIREKGGTGDALAFPDGFINAVSAIQVIGDDTMETGEFIGDGTNSYTIAVSGKKSILLVYSGFDAVGTENYFKHVGGLFIDGFEGISFGKYGTGNTYAQYQVPLSTYAVFSDTSIACGNFPTGSNNTVAGVTYSWWAW